MTAQPFSEHSRPREPGKEPPPGCGARILGCRVAIRGDIESPDLTRSNPAKTSPGKRAALGEKRPRYALGCRSKKSPHVAGSIQALK